ncbi:tetratricopeptide repeat protein [Terriglobus aquaticus]|uniref:Tetratricopeptide repeat protein n=1 Tax=Terriglobus aquaticus TaxID=940139 RepID=A0ABW9KNK0_9BACT|nr:tetratricopeptide repeat protein [Terriglobus aquaticus]
MYRLSVSIVGVLSVMFLAPAPLRAQQAAAQLAGAGNIPASIPATSVGADTATHVVDGEGPPSMMLADSLVARGRYLAAIRVYSQLSPVSADVQNRMGVASERMLMFDQAQHCFEAALKLDPKMGDAWNNLGTVMHSRGDLGKAEKYYRKALKLKPTNADTFQNLGALYYSKRNYNKGDAMYRQAIRLDPEVMERTAQHGVQTAGTSKNQAEMHYHQACTFAQSGNPKLALEFLRRSIVEGFHDRNRLLHESSFADLRTSEPFLRMVDDLKSN